MDPGGGGQGSIEVQQNLRKRQPSGFVHEVLDEKTKDHHIGDQEYKFPEGRAEEAPQLHTLSQSKDEYLWGNNIEECNWTKPILKTIDTTPERACRSVNSKRRERGVKINDAINNDHQQAMCQRESEKRSVCRASGTSRVQQVVSLVGRDLGHLVLWGFKRQVQGSNGLNPAQPCRPQGLTRTVPSGHNRVQYPCPDGHADGMGYCSHTLGGFAGRQDPVVLQERSNNQSRMSAEFLLIIINTIITTRTDAEMNRRGGKGTQRLLSNQASLVRGKYYNTREPPARRRPGELYCMFESVGLRTQ